MRVAIDARMIDHTGIGSAIRSWLDGFASMPADERPEFVLLGGKGRLQIWAEKLGAKVIPFDSPIYSPNEQIEFAKIRPAWDLFHAPHYNIPLSPQPRLIVTIHDLFHWKQSGWFKRRYQAYYLKQIRRRANRVCAVSEKTKEELIRHFSFDANSIDVVSGGIARDFFPVRMDSTDAIEFRRTHDLPEKYFLWMGILQPHKNVANLVSAVSMGYGRGELETPIVFLAPRAGDAAKLRAMLGDLKDRAIVLDRIERHEISLIYAAATALVFPSLEEGFGLPPLEAMAMEIPAAVSNRAPMSENCGAAALYFEPERPEDILRAMKELESDEELRNMLIKKGQERVKEFSSEKVAAKLLQSYKRAME